MFRIGVFHTDYTATSIPVAAHDAVARAVEDKAITLLKNTGVLPLTATAKSIAVIGETRTSSRRRAARPTCPRRPAHRPCKASPLGPGAATHVAFTPGNDPVNPASMIETADMTTVPSSVLTPVSGTAPGLTAQYWHTPDFTGPPAATRVDRQVNYDVGFASTFPGWASAGTQVPLPPTNFFLEQQAVKYDGFLTPPTTGDYQPVAHRLGRRDDEPRRNHDHRHDRPGRPPRSRLAGPAPRRRPPVRAAHRLPGDPAADQPATRHLAPAMAHPRACRVAQHRAGSRSSQEC